ncbi:hypothetical protein F8M49_01090 [Rhodococcus zopfii]|uniref:Uncharacterized protein n=1 Tax=Rhodococcus zopfii TaxID=43772 RepID=A0ABU3WK48_9NOCA|nr:hypothetical protein [Rhodococcus zopfii]
MAAFRSPGNGRAEFTLSNLYIYFWRWATWKVFESTAEPNREFGDTGIVAYITATGYLTGPGFKGMREYLRRKCSHGWIINVTPEGKKPPAKNAVFNIETPVAIGIFARTPDVDETVPAEIKYLDIHGTTQEKFAQLADLQFDDARWRLARTAWQAPFTPAAATSWDDYPAVGDLLPWVTTGVTPNRNWVIGPDKGTLELRLQQHYLQRVTQRKSPQHLKLQIPVPLIEAKSPYQEMQPKRRRVLHCRRCRW